MIFLILVIALLFESSCASTQPLETYPPLAPGLALEASPAFQRAVQSDPASREREKARIEYLLERIHGSPYNFIRNDVRYNGKRAWIHLRWKQFRFGKVETAEDFIQKVATSSKASGKPYSIEWENRKRQPLGAVLLNELHSFDQAVEKRRESITKPAESS